jgi:hypothetical protein
MILAPVVPVLVIVAFFGALIFAVMGRQVSEGIVGWLKDAGRIGAFLAGPTGAVAVKLTRWITHNVGAVFADFERLTVTWFSAIYQYFDLVITNALEWPVYLWRFQRWLLFHELPKLAHAVPKLATQVVHSVTTRVVHVERTIVKLPKLSRAAATALVSAAVAKWIHPYLSALRWLKAHMHTLTVAIPRALPIPTVPAFPNLWKRVRALEKRLAVPVGIAAVVAALGRLGLGWIRCNNVRKAGRSVCGIDSSLLDSLLLDTLAVFSIVSVVEFAHGLRSIEDEAVGILHHLIREFPAPPPSPSG